MIQYYLKNEGFEFKRGSEGAAGFDVRADLGVERTINPFERWKISTGLFLAMPRGVVAQICSRSGLAINHGIVVANAPGIVDSDYRGEVFVTLRNEDKNAPYMIKPGDRIAQILFSVVAGMGVSPPEGHPANTIWDTPVKVMSLDALGDTARGAGGHGSTGR